MGLCGCVWRPCRRAEPPVLFWTLRWGALTYIRSASTPHRNLTTIHRCLACSLRRSLLKTCSEISSVRVPRVVKVGHRFFCETVLCRRFIQFDVLPYFVLVTCFQVSPSQLFFCFVSATLPIFFFPTCIKTLLSSP